MSEGMSRIVFIVYSNYLATLISLPYALASRYLKDNYNENCAFTGVYYSSPTLAAAMTNLVPAFTFLLAVIFRFPFQFPLPINGKVGSEKLKKPDENNGHIGVNFRSND
ncbi:hypothetical protein FNV43_RR19833 [Rhamnella rubrinervis]|uniref:Uncharacterized protein n=1 Tax=Rhamnella rubrinervis TaxID=2594499 RepID=A0A8K0GWK4_9ROSA|nr:hypothetical protein FNV43_RR19833 [Rhamnella rubrinervis]